MKLSLLKLLWRHRFSMVGAVTTLHVALACCNPAKIPFPRGTSAVEVALRNYQMFSGTDNCFGFYAPAVGSAERVVCWTFQPGGRGWVEAKMPVLHGESGLRFGCIARMFEGEAITELTDASWAAWVFGQMHEADAVMVEHQREMLPTMAGHRAGEKVSWVTLKAVAFGRSGTPTADVLAQNDATPPVR